MAHSDTELLKPLLEDHADCDDLQNPSESQATLHNAENTFRSPHDQQNQGTKDNVEKQSQDHQSTTSSIRSRRPICNSEHRHDGNPDDITVIVHDTRKSKTRASLTSIKNGECSYKNYTSQEYVDPKVHQKEKKSSQLSCISYVVPENDLTQNVFTLTFATMLFFMGLMLIITQHVGRLNGYTFRIPFFFMSACMAIAIALIAVCLWNKGDQSFFEFPPTDDPESTPVTQYLLANAVVFGAGNFVLDMLNIAMFFQCAHSHQALSYAASFTYHFLKVVFVIAQIIFLQIFLKCRIAFYVVTFKCIIAHLMATNFLLWFNSLTLETGILDGQLHHTNGEHSVLKCPGNHTSALYSLAITWSENLAPFVLEYCLLAASLLYSMYPAVTHNIENKPTAVLASLDTHSTKCAIESFTHLQSRDSVSDRGSAQNKIVTATATECSSEDGDKDCSSDEEPQLSDPENISFHFKADEQLVRVDEGNSRDKHVMNRSTDTGSILSSKEQGAGTQQSIHTIDGSLSSAGRKAIYRHDPMLSIDEPIISTKSCTCSNQKQVDKTVVHRSNLGILGGLVVSFFVVFPEWLLVDKRMYVSYLFFFYWSHMSVMVLCGILAILVIYELKKNHEHIEDRRFHTDDYLLLITPLISFVPFLFALLLASWTKGTLPVYLESPYLDNSTVPNFDINEMNHHITFVRASLALFSFANMFVIFSQTAMLLMARSYERKPYTDKNYSTARIRVYMFVLLLVNLAFWVTDSFIELKGSLWQSFYLAYFFWGPTAWLYITRLLYPFHIFYRFHATSMIAHFLLEFRR